MDEIDKLLLSLSKTKFRGSFHLNDKMKEYVINNGIDKIKKDTIEIINKRIKIKQLNDGKQTPMKQVHPTFIAQHATGTCCRSCLKRIHKIDDDKELSQKEIEYITDVIVRWINMEMYK